MPGCAATAASTRTTWDEAPNWRRSHWANNGWGSTAITLCSKPIPQPHARADVCADVEAEIARTDKSAIESGESPIPVRSAVVDE